MLGSWACDGSLCCESPKAEGNRLVVWALIEQALKGPEGLGEIASAPDGSAGPSVCSSSSPRSRDSSKPSLRPALVRKQVRGRSWLGRDLNPLQLRYVGWLSLPMNCSYDVPTGISTDRKG